MSETNGRMMGQDDAEEFTQALGQVVAGGWRLSMQAWRLGVPQALGMSHDAWVNEHLGGYVRMSIPERREVVAELAEGGLSNVAIADVLGVDEGTVRNDKRAASEDSDAESSQSPSETASQELASEDSDADPNVRKPHVAKNTGDNEWYTPAPYIDAARSVMGAIDLDPASSAVANGVVGAVDFYDSEDDGLAQDWAGRIWMNPPYEGRLIGKFCEKLARSFSAGDVAEAIALTNNATETDWFQALAQVGSAICFPRSRVKFWHPKKVAAPLQGQAVVYLGGRPDVFRQKFGRFGVTVTL